jgi:hypothetical protein
MNIDHRDPIALAAKHRCCKRPAQSATDYGNIYIATRSYGTAAIIHLSHDQIRLVLDVACGCIIWRRIPLPITDAVVAHVITWRSEDWPWVT